MLSSASLVLTLRGVAIQEDKFKKRRISIERSLFVKEAELIARSLVDLIVSGVQTPPRPATPLDAFLTEEDEFARLNTHFHYDHASVDELKKLYAELFHQEPDYQATADTIDHSTATAADTTLAIFPPWSLSIDELKQELMELDDSPRKQSLLARLNGLLAPMYFATDKPNDSRVYSVCYQLLCGALDDMATDLFELKVSLNLPTVALEDSLPAQVDQFSRAYEDWKKEFEVLIAKNNFLKYIPKKDTLCSFNLSKFFESGDKLYSLII